MELQELAKELFQNKEVRIFGTVKEPLFIAKDIGDILGIKDINLTINEYDNTKKRSRIVCTPGGKQTMNVLTEKGLCYILFTTQTKIAVIFQYWIFKIIKEIRLRGQSNLQGNMEKQQRQLDESKTLREEYKPIITYHELDINDFTNQPCVYLYHLCVNDFKFGFSGEIDTHLCSFKKEGCDPKLVKVWKCETIQIMKDTELKIKLLAKQNGILTTKYGKKEIICTDNINRVIEAIDKYVSDQNSRVTSLIEIRKMELEIEKIKAKTAKITAEVEKIKIINENKRLDIEFQKTITDRKTEVLNSFQDNIASDEEILQNDRSTDSELLARDWIRNNPPTNEKTGDYYSKYKLAEANHVKVQDFSKLMSDDGYKQARNGSYNIWKK